MGNKVTCVTKTYFLPAENHRRKSTAAESSPRETHRESGRGPRGCRGMVTRGRGASICTVCFIFYVSVSYAFAPATVQPLVGTGKAAGFRSVWIRKTTSFTLLSSAKGTSDESSGDSLQKAYVSKSLSKILGEQRPPGNRKGPASRFSVRSLFHRIVQTIIVRPGMVVGRWVLAKNDRVPFISDEESMRGRTAKDVDVGVKLANKGNGHVPVGGVAQTRKPVPPSETELQKPPTTLPKTERVIALIDRYSARRPDESPGQNSRPQLDGRDKPVRTEGQDRKALLLDSYAKRHKEGEEPAYREYLNKGAEEVQRKPILRSQYADFGDDNMEKESRKGKEGKETKRVDGQKRQEASRLDLLINRYADRAATRESPGKSIPIVRKTVDKQLKRSPGPEDEEEKEDDERRGQQDLRPREITQDAGVDDVID